MGFGRYTTGSIPHDATSSELGEALASLPSVDTVDVSTPSATYSLAGYRVIPRHRVCVVVTRVVPKVSAVARCLLREASGTLPPSVHVLCAVDTRQ